VPVEDTQNIEPKRGSRKPLCLCCSICCILTLVAIGILIYFYLPRYPTATVQQDQINFQSWTWNATDNTVNMDITVPIIIYNPNRFFLKLSFPASPIYYSRTNQYVGTTKEIGETKFPKKANTTIIFDVLLASGANSTALATSLAQDCGNPPNSNTKVGMNIKTHVDVWIIRNHVNIPISQSFNVPCSPASAALSTSSHPTLPSGITLPPGTTLPPNVIIPGVN